MMAAINGSTGPVTVEYHEKPTGTQLNLVPVDIPWKYESCSASRAILPNFESTRNEGKKKFHCYLWGEKAGT